MTLAEDFDRLQARLARLRTDRETMMEEREKAQKEMAELQGAITRLRKQTDDRHRTLKEAQGRQEDHMRKQAERDNKELPLP